MKAKTTAGLDVFKLEEFAPGMAIVNRVVRLVEIAEEEMVKVFAYPGPRGLFMSLTCPDAMIEKDPEVYRSHAAELVRRAKARESLAPATDAELLVAVLASTLIAPPGQIGYAVARELFVRVYPARAAEFPDPGEAWKGSTEEHIGQIRNRLKVNGRRL